MIISHIKMKGFAKAFAAVLFVYSVFFSDPVDVIVLPL